MRFAIVLDLNLTVEESERINALSTIGDALNSALDALSEVVFDSFTVVTQDDYVALQQHLGSDVYEITVNGALHHFAPEIITFDDVVMIANGAGIRHFSDEASVTYRNATGQPAEGRGDNVTIQNGTIFNVAMTGNA